MRVIQAQNLIAFINIPVNLHYQRKSNTQCHIFLQYRTRPENIMTMTTKPNSRQVPRLTLMAVKPTIVATTKMVSSHLILIRPFSVPKTNHTKSTKQGAFSLDWQNDNLAGGKFYC